MRFRPLKYKSLPIKLSKSVSDCIIMSFPLSCVSSVFQILIFEPYCRPNCLESILYILLSNGNPRSFPIGHFLI